MAVWGVVPRGRGVLLVAAAFAALVLLVAGTPSPEASAQTTGGSATPLPTATPPFLWVIPPLGTPAPSRLYVDPLDGRFRFDYTDERNRPVPGTAVAISGMRATDRVVSFKWSDTKRPCETATPAPPGRGPVATPTPGRCPMYVWATLDRQRRQVRATLFRRTVGGKLVANVVARSTPLPLPTAPDPYVAIQDYHAVPRRRIVQPTEQVSFKNNMPRPCRVTFLTRPGKAPADTRDFDLGYVGAGQVSRKFPLVPTPVGTPPSTPTAVPDIWSPGEHQYKVDCGGNTAVYGTIVIPG